MTRAVDSLGTRHGSGTAHLADVTDASAEPVGSPRRVAPSIFGQASMFVGALLVYALMPTRNFNYADDSLSWAYQLTQSGNLVNSHHLYLNPMRWLYQLLRDLGLAISPVTLLALYSAVWGAIGLLVLYRLLVLAGFGNLAIWGTLLCAFSAGYWSYSIVGDVYIPATSLMMIGVHFVYSGLTSDNDRNRWPYAIAAVLAFLLMLAHHQALVVFVVGLLPAAFLIQKAVVRERRVLFGVVVPVAVCALAVALYAVAYNAMPPKDQQGFVRFGAGYVDSFEPRADQKQLGLGSVVNVAAGEARALVSTNVMFRSPEVAQAIQAKYPYRATYPFPYLVRDIPIPVAGLLGLSALLAALLSVYLFARGLWMGLKEKGIALLVFIPMIPQLLFFAWWEGISDEFALWTLPLLAIVIAKGAAQMGHPLRWLRTIVGCLLMSTLVGSTLLYWNPRNDIDLVNDGYVNSLGENDVLIGFEDIQSDFRIKLAADQRGFEYLNFFNVGNSAGNSDFEADLDSAIRSEARIHVSPRLTYPPKSALVFKVSANPDFESQRAALLAKLRALPEVDWLKPAVFSEQYFRLDEGMPAPHQ